MKRQQKQSTIVQKSIVDQTYTENSCLLRHTIARRSDKWVTVVIVNVCRTMQSSSIKRRNTCEQNDWRLSHIIEPRHWFIRILYDCVRYNRFNVCVVLFLYYLPQIQRNDCMLCGRNLYVESFFLLSLDVAVVTHTNTRLRMLSSTGMQCATVLYYIYTQNTDIIMCVCFALHTQMLDLSTH